MLDSLDRLGCSFTETRIEKTWPVWLAKRLATKETIHTGLSCQGNGMISRKVIHAVHEALKTESAKDIIVGITSNSLQLTKIKLINFTTDQIQTHGKYNLQLLQVLFMMEDGFYITPIGRYPRLETITDTSTTKYIHKYKH